MQTNFLCSYSHAMSSDTKKKDNLGEKNNKVKVSKQFVEITVSVITHKNGLHFFNSKNVNY